MEEHQERMVTTRSEEQQERMVTTRSEEHQERMVTTRSEEHQRVSFAGETCEYGKCIKNSKVQHCQSCPSDS